MLSASLDVNFVPGATAYYDGMADFAVMSLASVTAANGNATLADATPAEWITGSPAGNANSGNTPNIVAVWCGSAEDKPRYRIVLRGGGHDDDANNGLYVYDFSPVGANQFQGASLLDISSVGIVPTSVDSHDPYPDGRPSSIHSYQGQQYVSSLDKHVSAGGSVYRLGNLFGKTWVWDGSGWTEPPGYPASAGSHA